MATKGANSSLGQRSSSRDLHDLDQL